jgi:hypothetical protein
MMDCKDVINAIREHDSVLLEEEKAERAKVQIVIEIRDLIFAGLPKNRSVLLDYFKEKRLMTDVQAADLEARIADGTLTVAERENIQKSGECVFERDYEKKLCIWHGNFKAMMREICTTLGVFMKKKPKRDKGEEASGGKQTFQHGFNIEPLRPRFYSNMTYDADGIATELPKWELMTTPHGTIEDIKIINDAAGRRTAIGRHEFCKNVRICLEIDWADNGVYNVQDLRSIFTHAQTDGIGACRAKGYGKFFVISFEVLRAPKAKKKSKEELKEMEKA